MKAGWALDEASGRRCPSPPAVNIESRCEELHEEPAISYVTGTYSALGRFSIRMIAEYSELPAAQQLLVAKACNHPNWLALPFRLELERAAA
jgi:hypothetical protein